MRSTHRSSSLRQQSIGSQQEPHVHAGRVLCGLERPAIPAEDLLQALAGDGTPCSLDACRQRFAQFVAGRLA